MESAIAAQHLKPASVALALAAASPTLGDAPPPFHATIHHLVCTIDTRTPLSFEQLAAAIDIPFTPSHSLTAHYQIDLPSTPTVAALVRHLISHLSLSPHSLHSFATLLEPQCDPALHGAYEPSSRVALFLRHALVAFHSLSFFAHARLTSSLRDYGSSASASANPSSTAASTLPPKSTKRTYATVEATRRANLVAAERALHVACDDAPPHRAALALVPFHASFGRDDDAAIAVHHALRAAQAASDAPAQAAALRWLASVHTPLKRSNILRHVDDPLAKHRYALLALAPERRYDALRSGRGIDHFVLQAAAWEVAGSVPTGLAVARMAWRAASKRDGVDASCTRAGIAVADLMALEGDFTSAIALLEDLERRFSKQETEKRTMRPERMLVERSITWLELERRLRRHEPRFVQSCVDRVIASAQAAVNNATLFSADELHLDALEASARAHILNDDALSAKNTAHQLTRRAAVAQLPIRAVEGIRLQAEAYLVGGSPIKGLPLALRAVAVAKGLRLYGLHVSCTLTLVETMLGLKDDECEARALATLMPVLPAALEGMGVNVRARALRLHAECLIAVDAARKREPQEQSLKMLRDALQAYELCEDVGGVRSCAYTLARVYDGQGNVVERDQAACCFRTSAETITARVWTYPQPRTSCIVK